MINFRGNSNRTGGDDKVVLVSRTAKGRIRRWVISIHLALIAIPLIWYAAYKWLEPERKVIKIKLVPPPPPGSAPRLVPDKAVSKPVSKPKPRPKPVRKPKPKPSPKPKPKAVQKPKPKPVRRKLTADDIKISRDVVKKTTSRPAPPQPKLRPLTKDEVIRKLNQAVSQYQHNIKADRYDPSAKLNYQQMIGLQLKQLWNEPDKRQLGRQYPKVTVSLTISGSGRVTRAVIVKASGIGPMDRSVTKLLSSLRQFSPPPGGQAISFNAIMEIEKD